MRRYTVVPESDRGQLKAIILGKLICFKLIQIRNVHVGLSMLTASPRAVDMPIFGCVKFHLAQSPGLLTYSIRRFSTWTLTDCLVVHVHDAVDSSTRVDVINSWMICVAELSPTYNIIGVDEIIRRIWRRSTHTHTHTRNRSWLLSLSACSKLDYHTCLPGRQC